MKHDIGPKRNWLPYIVAATFFMEYLDTTVIATALPQMARSFAVGPNEVSLGLTAYMLTLAVFIPISGWVADRLGSRTVFATALGIFVLASVACGFSTGILSFTAARVLQGIGGAMMVPVGRMIVVRNTEKSRLMHAISTITWPAIVAPLVGPTVGGFITTYASWHWIFFLNVPFGAAALTAILVHVPNQKEADRRPLDLLGFLLTGATLVCILYGTEMASNNRSSLLVALGITGAGVLIGAVAAWHMRRHAHPILDLTALRIQTFSATVMWGSATRTGIEAVPYLSPLLFQVGFGLSAFQSGLLLLATATGNISMKLVTTPILRRFGFRTVTLVNSTLAAVFILACGQLMPSTPLLLTIAVLFLYGLARSLQFTTLATLAYADVSDALKSRASTLWSSAQQMTLGMGIAFGALSLRVSASLHAAHGRTPTQTFTLADFHWAFAAAALLTLASVMGYRRLAPDAGGEISGRPSKPATAATPGG